MAWLTVRVTSSKAKRDDSYAPSLLEVRKAIEPVWLIMVSRTPIRITNTAMLTRSSMMVTAASATSFPFLPTDERGRMGRKSFAISKR